MVIGDRWKDADQIRSGDRIRIIGQHEFARVLHVWVEGDTVTVTDENDNRLPILAPKERVEVDPSV